MPNFEKPVVVKIEGTALSFDEIVERKEYAEDLNQQVSQKILTPEEATELFYKKYPEQVEVSDDEMLAAYQSMHPELFPVEEENKAEHEPLVEEFNTLCAAFEAEHDLEALHAVTELDAAVAAEHPVREPARQALNAIQQQLKRVDVETAISDEAYAELFYQYLKYSQAVGIINRGVVDHTRDASPYRQAKYK